MAWRRRFPSTLRGACGIVKEPLSMQALIPLERGREPLSRQIYGGLRQAVLSGAFGAGERLPSTRDLAEQLGVLREAIAAHLRRSRSVACDASQVVVVNGSQQALDLIARVLIERGDRVVIEDPLYQGTRAVLRAAGARVTAVPVDRDGLDPAV